MNQNEDITHVQTFTTFLHSFSSFKTYKFTTSFMNFLSFMLQTWAFVCIIKFYLLLTRLDIRYLIESLDVLSICKYGLDLLPNIVCVFKCVRGCCVLLDWCPTLWKLTKSHTFFLKKVHTKSSKDETLEHFSLGINSQNMKKLENPFHTELCELSSTRLLHLCINWHNLLENRSYIYESILQSRHQNRDFIYQCTSLQLSNGLSSLCLLTIA